MCMRYNIYLSHMGMNQTEIGLHHCSNGMHGRCICPRHAIVGGENGSQCVGIRVGIVAQHAASVIQDSKE